MTEPSHCHFLSVRIPTYALRRHCLLSQSLFPHLSTSTKPERWCSNGSLLLLRQWQHPHAAAPAYGAYCCTYVHCCQSLPQLISTSCSASLETRRARRSKRHTDKSLLEFHPDKNKDEGAAEKFTEIARAYEVLSDEDMKEIYDQYGEEGLKQHEARGGGGGGGGGFEDIFSHFGFNFHSSRREQGEQQTPSVEIPLYVTLKQLYLGDSIDVEYVREVLVCSLERVYEGQ